MSIQPSVLGVAIYAAMLSFASSMSALGDGAPTPFSIWSFYTLFPFIYFIVMLITCFRSPPPKSLIGASILSQIAMLPLLLSFLFSSSMFSGLLLLGYIQIWTLMFLESCGVFRFRDQDKMMGLGAIFLSLVFLFFLFYAIFYWRSGLVPDGFIMIGISILPAVLTYFLFHRFWKGIRIGEA